MERIGIDTPHKLFYGHPPNPGEYFYMIQLFGRQKKSKIKSAAGKIAGNPLNHLKTSVYRPPKNGTFYGTFAPKSKK